MRGDDSEKREHPQEVPTFPVHRMRTHRFQIAEILEGFEYWEAVLVSSRRTAEEEVSAATATIGNER